MTVLVRNFYTNTGLKGSTINPNKPKLSVAFTAVRNEAGEQVVQYGVASCHPTDHAVFKRKSGLAIAKSRLELAQANTNIGAETGSVTFPAGTTLDQIPGLIVKTYNEQVRKAKSVKWKAQDAASKAYEVASRDYINLMNNFHSSPEFKAVQEALNAASEALSMIDYPDDMEDDEF